MFETLRKEVSARVVPAVPAVLRKRLVPERYGWSQRDMKVVATPPDGNAKVRLLIAPVNFIAQAYHWAQAANTLKNVSAVNLRFVTDEHNLVGPHGVVVDSRVGKYSHIWAKRQRKTVLEKFTHVLYEAERPIFRSLYDGDVAAEIEDLQTNGIQVAMVSHGSDSRTPSEHVKVEKHSPFVGELNGLTQSLQTVTEQNHAILNRFDVPKFVSTPDLLHYIPLATWLPTLVDVELWGNIDSPLFANKKPVVLHVPSRSALKGTTTIRDAMSRLNQKGIIEYVETENVPHSYMPSLVGQADIVIDQISMGLYGVASVEALLAGRIVVAQVGDFIRSQIADLTGWEVPIVEANPDNIYDVVFGIAKNPEKYVHLIEKGKQFVTEVHSRKRAAQALKPYLLG